MCACFHLFQDTLDVFEEFHIINFPTAGSLIAALRHGGMMVHDHDMDWNVLIETDDDDKRFYKAIQNLVEQSNGSLSTNNLEEQYAVVNVMGPFWSKIDILKIVIDNNRAINLMYAYHASVSGQIKGSSQLTGSAL